MKEFGEMNILVIGAGYVGLTTAVVLSQKHNVVLVEANRKRLELIERGKAPFYENDLESFLRASIEQGRIKPAPWDMISESYDYIIICVGTPSKDGGKVDLEQLDASIIKIDEVFDRINDDYLVVALRSTVPPGTTKAHILDVLSRNHHPRSFGVVFNPEFLRQGRALADIMQPDRVVIGASNSRALQAYRMLYSTILQNGNTPIFEMSIESAELCKYASNAFLSMKISFTNEISSIAERMPTVSIDNVLTGMIADHRICASHLKPGLGFGGACLPKDLAGLTAFGMGLGLPMELMNAVRIVNDQVIGRLFGKLKRHVNRIDGKKIAILGLAFKPGTDDIRGSQSIDLITYLLRENAEVWAHDPMVRVDSIPLNISQLFTRADDVLECVRGAEAVVVMTKWPEYCQIGIDKIAAELATKVIVDGVGVFANSVIPNGVDYVRLGAY
ncbi:MAG: UDP-glucose dehydrogenase family protein [Candidatus Thorarchaeota archaeon]